MSTAVTTELIGDLDAARPTWEALEADNPFGTWMFAEAWWRHLGDGRQLRLHAVRAGGAVVALLPLCDDGRELRLLGHGDADLLGPVCAPEHRDLALGALGRLALGSERRLVADELAAGSAAALGGRVTRRTASPVIDLPSGGFEALLAARSRNHRGAVRNRERRLARAHALRVRTADARTLSADLDTLFALHRARWNGTTRVFSGPRADLHRDLAARSLARGWLRLRVLELDGRPVAANYAWRTGEAEWFYQSGRDPEFDGDSVGRVLHAACIRAACEEGATSYRLLRGDEDYKAHWASRDDPVETVVVEPR